jgi:hypothetical protein
VKLKDVRSIVDMIRDTSSADLIILSLFLLPILLGSWSFFLLNNIGYFEEHNALKLLVVILISMVYVIGLFAMKCWDSHDEKLKRGRSHVKHRLEQRKGNRASFVAIREEVNKDYTDDFLRELIDKNPRTFRTVQVKRSDERLPGITLVQDESEDVQSLV